MTMPSGLEAAVPPTAIPASGENLGRQRPISWRGVNQSSACGGAAKLPRGQSIATLEQAVEMRNVAESRGKGDLGNGLVSRIPIEKLARAHGNPLLVEVLSHRATSCCKQTVHIAFGATKSCGQCCGTQLRV